MDRNRVKSYTPSELKKLTEPRQGPSPYRRALEQLDERPAWVKSLAGSSRENREGFATELARQSAERLGLKKRRVPEKETWNFRDGPDHRPHLVPARASRGSRRFASLGEHEHVHGDSYCLCQACIGKRMISNCKERGTYIT